MPRRKRPAPNLETNTPPEAARSIRRQTSPDSPPPRGDEDASAYERELDRLDAATSTRH